MGMTISTRQPKVQLCPCHLPTLPLLVARILVAFVLFRLLFLACKIYREYVLTLDPVLS